MPSNSAVAGGRLCGGHRQFSGRIGLRHAIASEPEGARDRRSSGRLPFLILRLWRRAPRVRSGDSGAEPCGELTPFSPYIASTGDGRRTPRPRVCIGTARWWRHVDGVRLQLWRACNTGSCSFIARIYSRESTRDLIEEPIGLMRRLSNEAFVSEFVRRSRANDRGRMMPTWQYGCY